jgi:hypothetical protein
MPVRRPAARRCAATARTPRHWPRTVNPRIPHMPPKRGRARHSASCAGAAPHCWRHDMSFDMQYLIKGAIHNITIYQIKGSLKTDSARARHESLRGSQSKTADPPRARQLQGRAFWRRRMAQVFRCSHIPIYILNNISTPNATFLSESRRKSCPNVTLASILT